jgi:clan AA aspartic protease
MELVTASIKLSNPVLPERQSMDAACLVDSGSTYLSIPQHMALQLGLKMLQQQEAILDNRSSKLVRYIGPVKLQLTDRRCFVGAMVMGHQVLFGAIPMKDMDLVIHPKLLTLSVNPASPNVASSMAK